MAKSLVGIGLLEATLNFGKEVEAFHRFLDRCVGWGPIGSLAEKILCGLTHTFNLALGRSLGRHSIALSR